MTPVFQDVHGTNGDCLRASIASMLDLCLGEVPHWLPTPGDENPNQSQNAKMQAWLRERGLCLLELPWPTPFCVDCVDERVPILGTVKSTLEGDFSHALVGKLVQTPKAIEFHVTHDPKGAIEDASKYQLLFVGFLLPVVPSTVMRYRTNLGGPVIGPYGEKAIEDTMAFQPHATLRLTKPVKSGISPP